MELTSSRNFHSLRYPAQIDGNFLEFCRGSPIQLNRPLPVIFSSVSGILLRRLIIKKGKL